MLPIKDIKPHAVVTREALKWAKSKLKNMSRPWIGYVPNSCAPIRDWWGWEEVAEHCTKTYGSTNLVFSAGSIPWGQQGGNTPIIGESMDRVTALLSLCDIVAGVDTGPMHSAASLERHTVWVFTHIDGDVRTKGYKNAVVVQKKESCPRCPCWYSSPCNDGRQSPCGEAVKIEHVTEEIDKIWKHIASTVT
jgi:ADP-heptose:LPS heptosyltransferase